MNRTIFALSIEKVGILIDLLICSIVRADNTPAWEYNSVNASQSALIILAGSLEANKTYQFDVFMINRRNVTAQATGYVLIQVETTHPQMIAIA